MSQPTLPLEEAGKNQMDNTQIINLADQAIEYARRGWSIIPIGKNKKPALASWKIYQTRPASNEELRQMFTRDGVTGLAVICGKVSGNLVVRDFDSLIAYENWAKAHPDLSSTLPTVTTKRAMHVYFQHSTSHIIKCGDGEIRGAGYVLLPPSRHPDGGKYEWVHSLPDDLLPMVNPITAGLGNFETEMTETTEMTEMAENCFPLSPLSLFHLRSKKGSTRPSRRLAHPRRGTGIARSLNLPDI